MQQLLTIVSHVWQKITEVMHYPLGWIAGFALFIGDAVSQGRLLIYLVVLATSIDLVCGIAVAVKRKNFTRSELMRQTVEKLVVYGSAILVFLAIDRAIEQETGFRPDITSGILGVIITLTETWSFLASMMILFPGNPFLRMFQKALIGEIARKIGCDEADVEQILKESIRKKKQPRDKQGRYASFKTKK